jgi:hypothetical protein
MCTLLQLLPDFMPAAAAHKPTNSLTSVPDTDIRMDVNVNRVCLGLFHETRVTQAPSITSAARDSSMMRGLPCSARNSGVRLAGFREYRYRIMSTTNQK